ncbi:MAG TPA: hypothetical protein VJG85_01670 [Patescibacteria group bacterium]|nr:hypothetical protein [Patescibacteria group bacterium]
MNQAKKLLAEGLQSGFAGGNIRKRVIRDGVEFETSTLSTSRGRYVDGWAADVLGAGHEVAKTRNTTLTRVYAGGTIKPEELLLLGISKKDVMRFLKQQILALGSRTRLDKSCGPVKDGQWKYFYKVTKRGRRIPVIIGEETIWYKNRIVFVHYFLLCPVK